eukprot:CAMPEP_0175494272 /NCGR_PEP_ID=MMETSP0096-20121207/3197_1 /TAXON_ID=311494 /ORGANISM="Alexandrium monilatum, Strain CCMP3105" /LENGTH=251 /DNA_ID=CAMNT_0016796231 /DNA_START=173 /DNA_END=924 /DNA_ORIENTATION=+
MPQSAGRVFEGLAPAPAPALVKKKRQDADPPGDGNAGSNKDAQPSTPSVFARSLCAIRATIGPATPGDVGAAPRGGGRPRPVRGVRARGGVLRVRRPGPVCAGAGRTALPVAASIAAGRLGMAADVVGAGGAPSDGPWARRNTRPGQPEIASESGSMAVQQGGLRVAVQRPFDAEPAPEAPPVGLVLGIATPRPPGATDPRTPPRLVQDADTGPDQQRLAISVALATHGQGSAARLTVQRPEDDLHLQVLR